MPIYVNKAYMGLESESAASNHTTDFLGVSRRTTNRSDAVKALIHGLNHLIAWHPMPIFQKCQPFSKVNDTGADPLYLWKYDDNTLQTFGQYYRATILAVPRVVGGGYSGYSYGTLYLSIIGTQEFISEVSAVSKFSDIFITGYDVDGTNASPGIVESGLSTFHGFSVLSFSVEQKPAVSLELDPSAVSSFATEGLAIGDARPGNVVKSNKMNEVITKMDELRSLRLGTALSWCATGFSATPAVPGDHTGLHVDSATYVNLFDQSATTRTATSVGSSLNVQYGGIGPSDEVHGQRVKVLCRAYAQSVGGASTIKFMGPAHLTNNYTEITVPSGFKGWVGDATNFIYLNPNAAPTDVTTSCNKIDIHGKTAGTDLYVYALRGIRAYP